MKGFIVGKWYKRRADDLSGHMQKDKMYLCVSLQGTDPHFGIFKTDEDHPRQPGAWMYFHPTHYEDPDGLELGEPTLVESLNPPPDPPPPPTVEQPEDPALAQALRHFETGQMEAAVRRFLYGSLTED